MKIRAKLTRSDKKKHLNAHNKGVCMWHVVCQMALTINAMDVTFLYKQGISILDLVAAIQTLRMSSFLVHTK